MSAEHAKHKEKKIITAENAPQAIGPYSLLWLVDVFCLSQVS